MHQSGHSRAHSMQTVQFSSRSAITPRDRGGNSGSTSGYCRVVDRRVMVLSVTASPLASPEPGTPLMAVYPARSAPSARAPADLIHHSMIADCGPDGRGDRKSTRLNSSHVKISYAVFCLKKK